MTNTLHRFQTHGAYLSAQSRIPIISRWLLAMAHRIATQENNRIADQSAYHLSGHLRRDVNLLEHHQKPVSYEVNIW